MFSSDDLGEVILITGKRGSGKTALGFYILENSKNAYVVGLSEEKWGYLPSYIAPLKSFDLPYDATIFFDEAALLFYARDFGKALNKQISQLVTEARHKNQRLIFASHTLRKLDIGIIIDADAIFFKEPSRLHTKYERGEIKAITESAREVFDKVRGDKRKYAYLLSHDREELIETPLPPFWHDELSFTSRINYNSLMLKKQKPTFVPEYAGEKKNSIVYDSEGNKVVEYIRFDTAHGYAILRAKEEKKTFYVQSPTGEITEVKPTPS